jgi:hypothetical protein
MVGAMERLLMADEETEKPIHSQVSAYLRRPLRTLRKAQQDNDAAPSSDVGVFGGARAAETIGSPSVPIPKPTGRETPANAEKGSLDALNASAAAAGEIIKFT